MFHKEGKPRNSDLKNLQAGERDPAQRLLGLVEGMRKTRMEVKKKRKLWSQYGVLGKEPDLAGKATRVEPPTRLVIPDELEMEKRMMTHFVVAGKWRMAIMKTTWGLMAGNPSLMEVGGA